MVLSNGDYNTCTEQSQKQSLPEKQNVWHILQDMVDIFFYKLDWSPIFDTSFAVHICVEAVETHLLSKKESRMLSPLLLFSPVILCKCETQKPVLTSSALFSSPFLHPCPPPTTSHFLSHLVVTLPCSNTYPDLALTFHFLSSLPASFLTSFSVRRPCPSLSY